MDEQVLTFGPFQLMPAQRVLLQSGKRVPLGSRALDLLIALIARPGEILGKEELIARVWPDTFVDDGNLRVHIAALRRALKDDGSATGFITNVPGRGYGFVAPVTGTTAPPAAAPPDARPPHSLPVTLGRVIGREAVVAAIAAQLPRQRLVTLVGPGGIGKTTVALAVAGMLAASQTDGAYFVDLAPVADPQLVPSALAAVLGHATRSRNPAEDLVAVLRGRDALFVLDNCEHVIAAAASLAAALLRGAPRLRILATSREPLRCEGEWVQRLPPLDLPPAGAAPDAEAALRFPAVQLFVERASAALGGYALSDAEAPAVAEICRRLDGMALAIELAAGRAGTLGIRGLAESLGDRFRVLTQGRRTALPRHQTLRATLDWSYRILPPFEQMVLRRLAVFNGDFTLAAAGAVAAGSDAAAPDIGDGVLNLVAKSLLAADLGGAVVRYRLLDTTRAYAREKLEESGESAPFLRRHAVYFQALFEQAEAEWERRPTAAWLEDYLHQLGDLRAALDWAFAPGGDAAIGAGLTAAAVPLWIQQSLVDECLARVQQALSALEARPGQHERQRMQLTAALGWPQMRAVAGLPSGEAAWSATLAIAEALEDTDYQLRALWALWVAKTNAGNPPAALALAERFCALAAASADAGDAAIGERLRARSLHLMGRQPEALLHIRRMLDRYAAPPNRSHIARFQYDQRITARITLARVLWVQGLPDQALREVQGKIDDAAALGHALSLAHALSDGACPVALLAGDLDRAEHYTAMLLRHTQAHTLDVWNAYAACFTGELRIRRGEPEAGLGILGDAIARLQRAGFVLYRTAFLSAQAQGLLAIGRIADALAAVDAALAQCAGNGEGWCLPELLRIRAEALLRQGGAAAAETMLVQALGMAEAQGALSWALRIALSLARMRRDQGRDAEARDLLAPIHARFTEGFATADMLAAGALLDEMARGTPA